MKSAANKYNIKYLDTIGKLSACLEEFAKTYCSALICLSEFQRILFLFLLLYVFLSLFISGCFYTLFRRNKTQMVKHNIYKQTQR